MKIFISSVQKEFAAERKSLAEYLSGDPLLRRFFETFLFERDVPAADLRPGAVYLEEVRNCDLYLGLFGDDYGWKNDDGLSPTLRQYIERMGTGTRDMIKKCLAAGLPEPEFSLTDSFVTTIRRNAVSKSRHVGSRITGQVTGHPPGQTQQPPPEIPSHRKGESRLETIEHARRQPMTRPHVILWQGPFSATVRLAQARICSTFASPHNPESIPA